MAIKTERERDALCCSQSTELTLTAIHQTDLDFRFLCLNRPIFARLFKVKRKTSKDQASGDCRRSIFTSRMPFLLPCQQRQSIDRTEQQRWKRSQTQQERPNQNPGFANNRIEPESLKNVQESEILGSFPVSTEQENARDQKHLTYGEDESWNRCESIVVDECDGIGQMTFTSTNECQSMPFATNTRG